MRPVNTLLSAYEMGRCWAAQCPGLSARDAFLMSRMEWQHFALFVFGFNDRMGDA